MKRIILFLIGFASIVLIAKSQDNPTYYSKSARYATGTYVLAPSFYIGSALSLADTAAGRLWVRQLLNGINFHNPVTIGTSNGLSITTGQALSLDSATSTTNGAMSKWSYNKLINLASTSTGLSNRGFYDASTNVFPSSGGSGTSGAILKGDYWTISVQGVLGGDTTVINSRITAMFDAPGQTFSNWNILQAGLGYTPENSQNKVTTYNTSYLYSKTKYPSMWFVSNYMSTDSILTNPANRYRRYVLSNLGRLNYVGTNSGSNNNVNTNSSGAYNNYVGTNSSGANNNYVFTNSGYNNRVGTNSSGAYNNYVSTNSSGAYNNFVNTNSGNNNYVLTNSSGAYNNYVDTNSGYNNRVGTNLGTSNTINTNSGFSNNVGTNNSGAYNDYVNINSGINNYVGTNNPGAYNNYVDFNSGFNNKVDSAYSSTSHVNESCAMDSVSNTSGLTTAKFGKRSSYSVWDAFGHCRYIQAKLPTITLGTGAGTGATYSLNSDSNDQRGEITVTTGTSPDASGIIFTLTYAYPYKKYAYFIAVPADNNSASVQGQTRPHINALSPTSGGLTASGIALSASTTYTWRYFVCQ